MSKYQIAGCTIAYEPLFQLLRRKMEPYRVEDMETEDFRIELTESYCKERRKENRRLSLEQAEYVCAGIEFYQKLLEHGGFLLHASALEYEGKAYVFTAPSGTGKSTHARMWQQCFGAENVRILNDDKPAIRIEETGCMVYGTPFSGKTDLNLNRKAPLGAVCILTRGTKNKVMRMEPKDAVPYLFSQTILPNEERPFELLFNMLEQLFCEVPVYKMECTATEEAAQAAYEAMKGD